VWNVNSVNAVNMFNCRFCCLIYIYITSQTMDLQSRLNFWNLVPKLPDINHKEGITLGTARRYAPASGSSIQKSRWIYIRPWTGPQSAHLWWPAAARLQAAYSLGSCTAGQTDGRITLFQNAPPQGVGIIITITWAASVLDSTLLRLNGLNNSHPDG